jgi:hypothetical protein
VNPKIQHAIAEVAQIGGAIGSLASIVGTLNPVAGTVCAIIGGIATVLKPYAVANLSNLNPNSNAQTPQI